VGVGVGYAPEHSEYRIGRSDLCTLARTLQLKSRQGMGQGFGIHTNHTHMQRSRERLRHGRSSTSYS